MWDIEITEVFVDWWGTLSDREQDDVTAVNCSEKVGQNSPSPIPRG